MSITENFVNSVCEYHDEAESMHSLSVNTPENSNISSDSDTLQTDIEKRVEKIARMVLNKTEAMIESEKQPDSWEKDLLSRCKAVLEKSSSVSNKSVEDSDVKGTYTALAFGIGKLINLMCYLYEKYSVKGTNSEKELKAIDQAGLNIMPLYEKSIINDVVDMIIIYYRPDIEVVNDTLRNLSDAKSLAANYRAENPNFTINEASQLLTLAECAYGGLDDTAPAEPFTRNDLPDSIKDSYMYNPSNGLFDIPGGMKILFCKWGNKIVIGFAGTQIVDKIATLGADIQQILAPNLMYLRAVGIVDMICKKYSGNYNIVITGHSLGGGLTQAAVLANCQRYENLTGAAFNSAGLSSGTINQAGGINALKKASERLTHYRAQKDPVSAFGALIGNVQVLTNATFPWHCISNIKNCFPDT